MSTIILTHQKWDTLKDRITVDYGKTMLMVSFKLKRELGFTVREHREWDQANRRTIQDIRLDFFDDQLETLFRLKYCEYL